MIILDLETKIKSNTGQICKCVKTKVINTSGECGGRGSAVHKVAELGISIEIVELDFGISPSGGSGGHCPSSDPLA